MTTSLIGLCGYARAGKDTAAANMPGWHRFAFADALKADLEPLLSDVGCDLTNSEHKTWARPLLVAWGATARAFRPAYWVERLFRAIDFAKRERVVISDVRYPNEVAEILKRGGRVVRIIRPGIEPANDEEARSIAQIERDFCLPMVKNDWSPHELGEAVLKLAGVDE